MRDDNTNGVRSRMFGGLFGGGRRGSVGKQGEKLPQQRDGLPESGLPHGLCPRCQKQSSFEVGPVQPVTFDPDVALVQHSGSRSALVVDQVAVLYCRNCRQGTVVIEEQCVADRSWREDAEARNRGGGITWRGIHWWPSADAEVSADVPVAIATVFREAARAAHAECPRASVVMARRTLEAVTVERGETTGSLADRVRRLASNGTLVPALADWAREVRMVGNVGAHFDPIETVSVQEAKELLVFVRELLRYLYELPAELARRRTP